MQRASSLGRDRLTKSRGNRRSAWIQSLNKTERGLSISRAMHNTINLGKSTHADIKRGIADMRCSYVPDFGYEEVVDYSKKSNDYWETIANCILNPIAPKHSTVLSVMQDKAIKVLRKLDPHSLKMYQERQSIIAMKRSQRSLSPRRLKQAQSPRLVSLQQSFQAAIEEEKPVFRRTARESVLKKRNSQIGLMMILKEEYRQNVPSDIPPQIEEKYEALKGSLKELSASHRRNQRNLKQVKRNYKGMLEEEEIMSEYTGKSTTDFRLSRKSSPSREENKRVEGSIRLDEKKSLKRQTLSQNVSPMKRNLSSAGLGLRMAKSTAASTERSPRKKIRSCVTSLQNSPNVKLFDRRVIREPPPPPAQDLELQKCMLEFSTKFMDGTLGKKKRKLKLGVINEAVLKEREALVRRIKQRDEAHRAQARERWRSVREELQRLKRKQEEKIIKDSISRAEMQPLQKLSQNVDYEPEKPNLD